MNGHINYQGYTGSIEFSEADAVFHGKVIGLKSLITFEGASVADLTHDFHKAVDEYLAFCAETGKQKNPSKGHSTCASRPIFTARPPKPPPPEGFP